MIKRKPRKTPRPKKAVREIVEGTPPVPHIVEPKPQPSLWERFKLALGW